MAALGEMYVYVGNLLFCMPSHKVPTKSSVSCAEVANQLIVPHVKKYPSGKLEMSLLKAANGDNSAPRPTELALQPPSPATQQNFLRQGAESAHRSVVFSVLEGSNNLMSHKPCCDP